MLSPPNQFRSTALPAVLKERAKLLAELRKFFDIRDFFEVQTPVMSHDVLVDRYIEPLTVSANDEILYLQTSPEFAMKRLLASGCSRIYEITPAFRCGDRGPFHNPEFTMLEWYRAGDGYEEGISLLKELADTFLTDPGTPKTECRSFGSLFQKYVGINPYTASVNELHAAADELAPNYPASYVNSRTPATADDWIDYLFEESVQNKLGANSPVILCDYPVSQSQLAKIGVPLDSKAGTNQVSRRFELFYKGVELANGYDELTDPSVLRHRFAETASFREERNAPALPTESRLLAAMDAGYPASSGCALGVDRLLMLRLGLEKIDDVIPFPIEIA